MGCTEGKSILPLFENPEKPDWDNVVPWQMGYSIRTDTHRYAEYVQTKHLGGYAWEPNWDKPVDHEELYDHTDDPQENFNRYDDPEYIVLKRQLSEMLHSGWSP